MWQLLTRYWLPLLTMIAALLILGGALFGSPSTSKAGWVLLGLVLTSRLAVWITQDMLRGKSRVAIVAVALLVATIVGLAIVELALHAGAEAAELLAKLPKPIEDLVRWAWPWGIPHSTG
jgi:hypothetical protein